MTECLFFATYSANTSYPVGSNDLLFDNIVLNRGTPLSNTGGVSTFTAPLNGYYSFNCYPNAYIFSATNGSADVTLSLVINGTTPIVIQPSTPIVNNIQRNIQSFDYYLNLGDTVVANMTYSSVGDFVMGIQAGSTWSGCLLRSL